MNMETSAFCRAFAYALFCFRFVLCLRLLGSALLLLFCSFACFALRYAFAMLLLLLFAVFAFAYARWLLAAA